MQEFAKKYNFKTFMGLAPRPGMQSSLQRESFVSQFKAQYNLANTADLAKSDWLELFHFLATQHQTGKVVILFDEISWMAVGDLDFLGKLKTAWDLYFSKNSKLMLILCGSVSSWIEENIIKSTGFLGRPNLSITLKPLPLAMCNLFWREKRSSISSYEKLKLLAVTGGIPRYLEMIDPNLTAEENIKNLCFNESGALFIEFDLIFSDIYGKKGDIYKKIITIMLQSKSNREIIKEQCGLANNGKLTEYLNDLIVGGLISKDYTWSIKTKSISNLCEYRITDNYTRFYLKYIHPNRINIEKEQFINISLSNLPGWHSILGLQFEQNANAISLL